MDLKTIITISLLSFIAGVVLSPRAKTHGKKLLLIFAVPVLIVSILYFGEPLVHGRYLDEHKAWAGLIIPLYSAPGIVFSFLGLMFRLAVINKFVGR